MNFSKVKRTSKKTLVMFLGDVKMGAQERQKTVIIIFGTYGSKTKKKFSQKKKRNYP